MRLGIIADTHDNVAAVRTAVTAFAAHEVDVILHCGDVIAPPVISEFEGFRFHLVFGNNDGDRVHLRQAVEALDASSTCHGLFAHLSFRGIDIGMLHGEKLDEVAAYAKSGTYDYVVHGHHHEIRRDEVGDTVVLNPGGHFPTIPADHRCVATIDTETGEDRFIDIAPE